MQAETFMNEKGMRKQLLHNLFVSYDIDALWQCANGGSTAETTSVKRKDLVGSQGFVGCHNSRYGRSCIIVDAI